MEKGKNNTVLLTVIGIATLLVAVVGATFAYFSARINGTDTSAVTITAAGEGTHVEASGGEEIALNTDGIYPSSEAWLEQDVEMHSALVQNNGTWTFKLNVTTNTFESAGTGDGDEVDFDDLTFTFTQVSSDSYGLLTALGTDEPAAMPKTGGSVTAATGTVKVHDSAVGAPTGSEQGFKAHYKLKVFFNNDSNRNQNYADANSRKLVCYVTMSYQTDATTSPSS